jgi:NADPH-dependent glutamate synthase beta subunit-like oxidoreductase
MAIGSLECKLLGIEGEEIDGVWPGMDYLLRTNLGEKIDLGDRVAVIGGGNVAMDSVEPPCAMDPKSRLSSTAAARRRCRPAPKRSKSAGRKASRS